MTEPAVHWLTAEPLRQEAFAPFGQVIGAEEVRMELRGDEVFHLDVLSYDHRPLRMDHLNRHHKATQALYPLHGCAAVLVVGAAQLDFADPADLAELRAFVLDGTAGVNLALGTWHEGPWPVGAHVDLLNVQGRHVEGDNEVAHLARDLGVVIGVRL
ncbi:MAG: ureidoglycolate lyase [Mycobacteriales bacterium]